MNSIEPSQEQPPDLTSYYLFSLQGKLATLRELQAQLEEHIRLRREAVRLLEILQHLPQLNGLSEQALLILNRSEPDLIRHLSALLRGFPSQAELAEQNRKTAIFWLDLHSRIQEITDVFADLTSIEEIRDSIRRLSHILRGSAGTFGFAQISQLAATVEEASEKELYQQLQALIALITETVAGHDKNNRRILVVDDDQDIQHFLKLSLEEEGYAVTHCSTIAQAWKIMNEETVELVILDLILPDGDGRNLLLDLRISNRFANIPIVVLSSKGLSASSECYALGADLYFEKPLNSVVPLVTAVSKRLLQKERSEQASQRDFLTGLLNRGAFHEIYAKEHELAQRKGLPLTLAELDMDHFKQINDIYGHAMGDLVLQKVSEILKYTLRPSDFIARWGGEEMAILMPATDQTEALLALQKCQKELLQQVFETEEKLSFHVTFSAGVYQVTSADSINSAMINADRLLYQAKKAGRNRLMSDRDVLSESVVLPKIMIVEDDPCLITILRNRFESRFQLAIYTEGGGALQALQHTPVDLVLLDLQLPDMTGFDILSQVRKKYTPHELPVIIMTAQNNQQNVLNAFNMGANDYIPKPFSPLELEVHMQRFIKR